MTKNKLRKKPTILITNDDSYSASGLRKLIKLMRPLGHIVVVASDQVMSGMGHAITIKTPLRMKQVADEPDYEEYVCNGTPVDCVKLGTQVVLHAKPDLLVSGINHGSNASINVIYSGTMAAVLEACIDGIPAVGYSLLDYNLDADFDHVDDFVVKIAQKVLAEGLPEGVCLNVNLPAMSDNKIKGVKVCRQSHARWVEEFDSRQDPRGGKYHWLTGKFENDDLAEDTDQHALENNYVSVVPVHFDMTAYKALVEIESWNL
ncbi:MAG: 5'/3'-nucleotidase SurE [Bacteroidetes bacterium]|nr:5'/3'-nucleotidase SurE [Bacteroidota bacterium]MBU1578003.1 5'/3'-nucleotidase SurE [Bacteroidota bacterium]MBU2558094.1 5'/3'-nucleotidase SurE [Bacteroidota bacterium]